MSLTEAERAQLTAAIAAFDNQNNDAAALTNRMNELLDALHTMPRGDDGKPLGLIVREEFGYEADGVTVITYQDVPPFVQTPLNVPWPIIHNNFRTSTYADNKITIGAGEGGFYQFFASVNILGDENEGQYVYRLRDGEEFQIAQYRAGTGTIRTAPFVCGISEVEPGDVIEFRVSHQAVQSSLDATGSRFTAPEPNPYVTASITSGHFGMLHL